MWLLLNYFFLFSLQNSPINLTVKYFLIKKPNIFSSIIEQHRFREHQKRTQKIEKYFNTEPNKPYRKKPWDFYIGKS